MTSFSLLVLVPLQGTPLPAQEARPGLAYAAEYSRSHWVDEGRWHVRGSVESLAAPGATTSVRVEGEVTAPSGATLRLEAERRNDTWIFLDHTARTWTRGAHSGAAGPDGEALAGMALAALGNLAARACEAKNETRAFGKVTCQVVECFEDPVRTTWYLGVLDGLPRLVERTTTLDANERLAERLQVVEPRVIGPDHALSPLQPPSDYREVAAIKRSERSARPTALDSPVSLADSLAPLREHFNAGSGHTRWIGLFAPS